MEGAFWLGPATEMPSLQDKKGWFALANELTRVDAVGNAESGREEEFLANGVGRGLYFGERRRVREVSAELGSINGQETKQSEIMLPRSMLQT